VENVGCREAKQSGSRSKKTILPAVVLDEARAMDSPVVLDREPVIGVVEVWPAEKSTTAIVK
jgi:hypothetical protein